MADGTRHTEAWQDKPWHHFHRVVFRLQKRIYQTSQRGDSRTVHKLQRLLLSSSAARHLAVRHVTQDNQGKRTAGIDGRASLKPHERLQLVQDLKKLEGEAMSLRRTSIQKLGTVERRPLGIPTMDNRSTTRAGETRPGTGMGGQIRAELLWLPARTLHPGCDRRGFSEYQTHPEVCVRYRHRKMFRSCMLMPPSRTRMTCLRSNIALLLAGEDIQHIDMLCISHSVCQYALNSVLYMTI